MTAKVSQISSKSSGRVAATSIVEPRRCNSRRTSICSRRGRGSRSRTLRASMPPLGWWWMALSRGSGSQHWRFARGGRPGRAASSATADLAVGTLPPRIEHSILWDRRRAARALLPALDARVPGRARCARTRRAPAAARGHQRSPTVSGFYYVGLPFQRSFASATLRAVGAVADHVVRTRRRRLDAPGGACCGARRRRLPRASRSSTVRTASWLTDWAHPHPTAHGDGRMTRSGAGAAVGPPSRPEPLSGHPPSDRRVGCAASPAAVQGVRRTRSQDLTMRTLSVRARRLEATFCPLYVWSKHLLPRHSNSSPLALAPPGVRPASESRAQVPRGSP